MWTKSTETDAKQALERIAENAGTHSALCYVDLGTLFTGWKEAKNGACDMKMTAGKRALDKIYKRRDRYEIPDWQRSH